MQVYHQDINWSSVDTTADPRFVLTDADIIGEAIDGARTMG